MKDLLVMIPIGLPVLLAIALAIFKGERKQRNLIIVLGVILNLAMVLVVKGIKEPLALHIFRLNAFIDIYFKVDDMSILFALLASVLWVFTTFYAFVYMTHEQREKTFFVFFTLTLGITIAIAFAGNLFTLYIFYELLTLATFPLVIHSGSKAALESGKKYLVYSFGGASLVLFGMILLFSMTQDLNFVEQGIVGLTQVENSGLLLAVYLSLFLGFGVKAAIVPFHSWLPQAMVAPTPVSALLHAVAVVKSGIFALIRVSYFLLGPMAIQGVHGNWYISILVGITILLGSLLALHQENLKKRLAYSTVSQLGYILLGIVLMNESALTGGLLHLVNHAVIKITLFFCAGAIYFMTGKKNIADIKGIGHEMPITMWCFGIASISLVGIPPTNGFVSKWFLALGGLDANRLLFAIILLVSAFLTAAYLLPIVVTAFFHANDGGKVIKKDPPLKMLLPIVVMTGLTVVLGLFPNIVLPLIESIVEGLL